MNHHSQPFLERLWPSRSGPSDSYGWRAVLLNVVIVIAIGLAAGPDFIAAMEMTTLLELLGASLFLTAYSAGAKLMAHALWRVIRNFVLSIPHVSIINSRAPIGVKAVAFAHVAVSVVTWLSLAIAMGMFGQHVFHLAVDWTAI